MPKSKTVKKIKAMKMKKILCLFLLPAMLACGKGDDEVVDDTPRKNVETTGRQMRAADDGAEAPLPPPTATMAYTLDDDRGTGSCHIGGRGETSWSVTGTGPLSRC